jgi:hypothetical protein
MLAVLRVARYSDEWRSWCLLRSVGRSEIPGGREVDAEARGHLLRDLA